MLKFWILHLLACVCLIVSDSVLSVLMILNWSLSQFFLLPPLLINKLNLAVISVRFWWIILTCEGNFLYYVYKRCLSLYWLMFTFLFSDFLKRKYGNLLGSLGFSKIHILGLSWGFRCWIVILNQIMLTFSCQKKIWNYAKSLLALRLRHCPILPMNRTWAQIPFLHLL